MFRKIPFVESELRVIDEIPGVRGRPSTPLRNTPVTPRENFAALYYDRKPFWMPLPGENGDISSSLYSNRLGRGGHEDSTDIFGLDWIYVPDAGGSIVRPGSPLFEDANDWKDHVTMPDVESWDWAAEAAAVKPDSRLSTQFSFINGFWFERLISFMDFMPAAIALIDDEQKDAIRELFQATTDMACKLVDIICENYPSIDNINVHDDWGAQKAPFFSQETAYELFVPYMKQLTDHIHSKGRIATLHSCGHNEDRIQCYIDGGFDQWGPQTMNNIHELYEKYGDKIIFTVWPDDMKFEGKSEEQIRKEAREFVEMYNKPGKPSIMSVYVGRDAPAVFVEEVYAYSRKFFAERG